MSIPPSSARPPQRRGLIVVALLLSVFMSAMEATVVGTAMPTVIADLGGIALYGWVGASYLLASTIMVPVFGKLADTWGRKPVLLTGIAVFLLGSIGSGLAPTIEWLIAARTLQGLGAGAMQPMALTIVGDIYTLRERGRVQAAFGAVWGLSGALGPLLGGLIVTHLSWPWVFWINVPFGLLSMVLLPVVYREQVLPRRTNHIDWAGALLITGASVALLLGAERTAPAITFPLGVVLTIAFVAVERRAASPILPLPLLMRPMVGVAALSSLVLGAAMMGAVLFTPLWAQGARGASPSEAGSVIATMLVGWPIAAAIANRLVLRFGFRRPVWTGAALVLSGLGLQLWAIEGGASLHWVRLAMFLLGCGMGLTITSQLLAVQVSAAHAERGVATSVGLFARSMGGALGAGALGAVLAAGLGRRFDPESVSQLLDPHARADMLDPNVASALDAALAPVWWTLVALAATNAVIALFYPRDLPREGAAHESLAAPSAPSAHDASVAASALQDPTLASERAK